MGFSHHILNKDCWRAEKVALFKGCRIERHGMQNFDLENPVRLRPESDTCTACRSFMPS